MRNKIYTFRDDLAKRLKNPKFRRAWEDSEPEYILATQLIERRLAKRYSQRTLAKKLKTSQAVISRIESLRANPSLSLLKRIASVLDTKLILQFK